MYYFLKKLDSFDKVASFVYCVRTCLRINQNIYVSVIIFSDPIEIIFSDPIETSDSGPSFFSKQHTTQTES